jgi:DNA repair protein RecO
MYQIHTSPGLIIDSKPYGEAGKILVIFTEDYGLVYATAQGIRLEKSKLRYHTQEYSLAVFSLVRGKEFWRLTSAAPIGPAQLGPALSPRQFSPVQINPQVTLTAKISLLLKRLLHGEDAHPELFTCIMAARNFMEEQPELSVQNTEILESLIVWRILKMLGYIGKEVGLEENLETAPLSLELLSRLMPKRALLNKHINKALRESQL